MEYVILKMKPRTHKPQIALLLAIHKLKVSEEQRKASIDTHEPLLAFALSCGMYSSPAVRIYTAKGVKEELLDASNIRTQDSVICRFIPAGLANHYRPSLLAGSIAKVDRFEDSPNHRIGQVDEFKKMLKHAKEANDMHAGEVYGDKSILATEAKELENRLLNLSEERNKSLHVLDEMHETLEIRLEASLEMKKATEQENKAKSKNQSFFSKKQSKTPSFESFLWIMVRGEIYVTCQDVKLLKENLTRCQKKNQPPHAEHL
ncbi:hypothetical protein Bca4012_050734 [Brassica carinata]